LSYGAEGNKQYCLPSEFFVEKNKSGNAYLDGMRLFPNNVTKCMKWVEGIKDEKHMPFGSLHEKCYTPFFDKEYNFREMFEDVKDLKSHPCYEFMQVISLNMTNRSVSGSRVELNGQSYYLWEWVKDFFVSRTWDIISRIGTSYAKKKWEDFNPDKCHSKHAILDEDKVVRRLHEEGTRGGQTNNQEATENVTHNARFDLYYGDNTYNGGPLIRYHGWMFENAEEGLDFPDDSTAGLPVPKVKLWPY